MKKIILLLSLAFLASSCNNQSSVSVEDQPTIQNSNQSILYTNNNLGFELTLPAQWKGYKAEETSNLVLLYLPTSDKNWPSRTQDGYAFVLGIQAYPKPQFNTNSDFTPENYLGENSKYVFTTSSFQDTPSDLINFDFRLGQIISSFRLK